MGVNYSNRFGFNKSNNVKKNNVNINNINNKTVVEDNKKEEVVNESIVKGLITNCLRLNIREKPDKNANILAILAKDSEVIVYPEESDEIFYKVKTDKNIYGYCMKEFITIE